LLLSLVPITDFSTGNSSLCVNFNQNKMPYSRSYIDSKFTCHIPNPKGSANLRGGWGPPPCLVWTSSPSHRLTLLFCISRFTPH